MTIDHQIINETAIKIINTPENYAAIYARVSGKADNNSINAQIQLATAALNKRNLLVYNTYIEHDSAKKLSPTERTSLSKLLVDAKNGCFKTVIVYRLDRLVRRYKDWLEIKHTFSKLGVKIIYSDDTQAIPANSLHGNFFEGLMVMVAEMEPDTISQRASNGRKFRREQGAYSSGTNIPFGYKREERNDSEKISKSVYVHDPIIIEFICYIFSQFEYLIKEDTSQYKENLRSVYTSLESAINHIEVNIRSKNIPLIANPNNLSSIKSTNILYRKITDAIINHGDTHVLSKVTEVKNHFIIEIKNGIEKRRPTTNIRHCLSNNIYSGFMLIDSKHPYKGLKSIPTNSTNDVGCVDEVDTSAFIKINNLTSFISEDTFNTVYPYLTYRDIISEDRTPNFLLKNIIKCSCNKKLYLTPIETLHCGNSKCKSFIKNDLLSFIISEIVLDCLLSDTSFIGKFTDTLNKKTRIDSLNIKNIKQKQFDTISSYVNSDDASDDISCINFIYDQKTFIDSYVNLCSQYREKLDVIDKLHTEINEQNNLIEPSSIESTYLLTEVSQRITKYILSNEEIFIPIFSDILKEVKVIVKNESNTTTGQLNIKYHFTPEKNRNIPKSLHKKAE